MLPFVWGQHRPVKKRVAFFWGAAALVLSACGDDSTERVPKAFSPSVGTLETAVAYDSQVAAETNFDGVIEAVNQAVVSAQTSGRIIELPFDVGDYVAMGDTVARFTDTEQKAVFAAANAQLEEANARFAEAGQQFKRVSDVYGKGVVAKANLDQAQASYTAAKARVESAQAALNDAQERLSHTVVTAPYSGIVVKRLTDVGATVAPGSPLIEGLSLNHLRVQVDIPQQHIGPLRRHKKARVILENGTSVDVTDMRIPPSANPTTHSFRVLLTLPEGEYAEPVFPGTLVKVAFVTGEQMQLLVADNAVAKRGEVTGVYVVDSEKVEFRYIRLGHSFGDHQTSVLSGLKNGEKVALDPVAAAAVYKNQSYSTP
ncbi:efflux RND transporter periplasmic adaptor subunit [Teredinibacter haidensis]|uniref:efflux RND transporter periplasmic adaptor subunit n=1 Tax=Teredinibacter haidensis TaxID=2731755 RepID=UPI0009488FF3|nr:efflux RND transporter periplasmic adaptor subunit [Teredinibacter haidensis]